MAKASRRLRSVRKKASPTAVAMGITVVVVAVIVLILIMVQMGRKTPAELAAEMLAEGKQLLANEEYGAAKETFNAILSRFPEQEEACNAAGRCLSEIGEIERLEAMDAERARAFEAAMARCEELLKRNDFKGAMAYLDKLEPAHEINGLHAEVRAGAKGHLDAVLAEFGELLEAGDFDGAIGRLDELAEEMAGLGLASTIEEKRAEVITAAKDHLDTALGKAAELFKAEKYIEAYAACSAYRESGVKYAEGIEAVADQEERIVSALSGKLKEIASAVNEHLIKLAFGEAEKALDIAKAGLPAAFDEEIKLQNGMIKAARSVLGNTTKGLNKLSQDGRPFKTSKDMRNRTLRGLPVAKATEESVTLRRELVVDGTAAAASYKINWNKLEIEALNRFLQRFNRNRTDKLEQAVLAMFESAANVALEERMARYAEYARKKAEAILAKRKKAEAILGKRKKVSEYFAYESKGRIYFVSGTRGDDGNGDGSRKRPWKTVAKAARKIRPGNTVVIGGGIYRTKSISFGPAGTGSDNMTVYMAAPGARVLFSRPDGRAPTVGLADHVRIEGLWFGGKWSGMEGGEERPGEHGGMFAVGGSPVGKGKHVIDCTIFGYTGGILVGSSEDLLLHGCRVVRSGSGHFSHGIYLSGGYTKGAMTTHVILDSNMFIEGEGYGIHEWHKPHSTIITRNIVARYSYGIVIDGKDHIAANNFVWKTKGYKQGPTGFYMSASDAFAIGNILGPGARVIGNTSGNTFTHNAFISIGSCGENKITTSSNEMKAWLGISEEEYDLAIQHIDQAFSQSTEDIYKDKTIEPAFEKLWIRLPKTSPLRGAGVAWYDRSKKANIGPDAESPRTEKEFWAAFRKFGLADWDCNGNKVQKGEEKEGRKSRVTKGKR